MKSNSLIKLTLIFVVSFLYFQNTNAAENFNPDEIKDILFSKNLTLKQGEMKVMQADDLLTKARLDLLPSINVAAALSGPSGFGAQAMATLPFLLPSNWFKMNSNKYLREAEIHGFESLALNTLLTAQRLYYTILRDQALIDIFTQYRTYLVDIKTRYENRVEKDSQIDLVGSYFLDGKIENADATILQAQQLVSIEKSSLNRLLIRRNAFDLKVIHPFPYFLENNSDDQIWDYLVKSVPPSPERLQVIALINASKSTKWANVFGFMNSANANTKMSASGEFGGLGASGSMNLGFGIIPFFSLGSHQVAEFEYQRQALSEEGWRIIQSSMAAIRGDKQQLSKLNGVEYRYKESLRLILNRIDRGLVDYNFPTTLLLQLLEAQVRIADTQLDLDFARLQIQRLLRLQLFAKITIPVVDVK